VLVTLAQAEYLSEGMVARGFTYPAARCGIRITGGHVLIWLKNRLLEMGYLKCGSTYPPGVNTADEDGMQLDGHVARSKIASTPLVIRPIDRVAHRVSRDR